MIGRVVSQLVGRGDGRGNPVGRGDLRHRQGLFPTAASVVETREQVAVDVDETGLPLHGEFLCDLLVL